MITLNEIAYDILGILRPHLTDDEEISLRQIKKSIHDIRAQFIRNELNKNRSVDPDIIQDLGLLEVEVVDSAAVENTPYGSSKQQSGINVYRTTLAIHSIIELHHAKALLRVSLKDKTGRPIPVVDYKQVPWIGNGRFNSTTHGYCYLLNQRIYFVLSNFTLTSDYVNVQGVFQDPTEAARFNYVASKEVYTDDSSYPIARWMVNSIKKELLSQFKIPAQAPADRENDSSGQIKEDDIR